MTAGLASPTIASPGDGTGTLIVSPGTAPSGSTGNTLTFTFTAGATAFPTGSSLTILIPAAWTTPQTTSSSTAGYVTATAGTCTLPGTPVAVTGAGPWTITVTMACLAGQTFTITYGADSSTKVTAPAATGTTTFTAQSSVAGGTLASLAASPTFIVPAATKLLVTFPGEALTAGTCTVATGPTAVTAGTVVTVTVKAVDANCNLVTSAANDVVAITGSTDANAILPSPAPLSSGAKTFSVTFKTATTTGWTVTATDTASSPLASGTSALVTVGDAGIAGLQVLLPGETAAPGTPSGKTGSPSTESPGVHFSVTVNAVDQYWNVVTTSPYTGTVTLTSTDPGFLYGGPYTYLAGDNGVHAFSIELNTAGTQHVTATDPTPSHTGISAAVTVGVTLTSIAVTPATPTIAAGATQQFVATGTYSDTSTAVITSSVTWTSTSTAAATIVAGTGLATGVAAGTTTIRATLGTVVGSTTLTVKTLTSIAVTPASPTIAVGATQQFTATGTYSDASTANLTTQVTWTSSSTSVATIGASTGLATGVSAGTTTVTATLVAVSGSTTATVTGTAIPGTYHPIAPVRLLDTRVGNGLSGKFYPYTPRTFQVAGLGGVPSNATAVTGNLTVTGSTAGWAVFLGPNPIYSPTSSTINFTAGQNLANGVTVALSASGTLSATYMSNSGNTTDLVFDVTGYFTPDWTGGTFHPIAPVRLLDTRVGNGLSGKLAANTPATFQVAGLGGVPSNATAVTGNLTVVNETSSWAVFLGPNPIYSPTSSTINFLAGDIRANGLAVGLSATGTLSATYMSNSGNTTDLVFDVTGYFTPDTTGTRYVAVAPSRLLDTRVGNGLYGQFSAFTPRTFLVTGLGGVPSSATAVTGNLTVVNQTAAWAVFLGPNPISVPTSSTINFVAGDIRANGVTVGLSGGYLSATYMSTAGNTTDLVFDLTGYFTP